MGKIFDLIAKLTVKQPSMNSVYDLWRNEYRHETQEFVYQSLLAGKLDSYNFNKRGV